MNGLAHVVLHLALCGPIARLNSQTTFATHVRMGHPLGAPPIDRTFSIERGYGDEAMVEFDAPQGLYRLQVSAPKYGCSASDFVGLLPDRIRNIKARLQGGAAAEAPVLLFSGTWPMAFSYSQPEFVSVDRGALCNKPIPNVTPLRGAIDNEQDAYYAQLYRENAAVGSQILVLKLRTPTSEYHYVRVPLPFPEPPNTWPSFYTMNFPEDYIDTLATEPIDTLLCPHLLKTSVS